MNTKFTRWMLAAALVGGAVSPLVVSLPAQAQVEVTVQLGPTMAPPAPPPEVVPAPPPHRFRHAIWQAGHYNWVGNQWVWVAGGYVEAPRAGAVWIPGAWRPRHGHDAWVPGHWR